MKPISVQLYSLREEAKKDFKGVLKRLAKIGFVGVEPAGLHGLSPKEFKEIIDELGLKVSSSHVPFPTEENIKEIAETARILGQQYVISGFGRKAFENIDTIKETAGKINKAIKLIKNENLKFAMHNHDFEFAMINGRLAYDHLFELTPDLELEIDTYWASNFEANDPAKMVAKFNSRTPFLHIKDGPLTKDAPMVAAGKGKMDFKKVIAAADPKVLQWLVVELDACATDMFTAVEESYVYLTKQGLAKGNR
jgi:sugar phosphate isomerase/epimerase